MTTDEARADGTKRRGFTVFLTGLPAAGKTTTAEALQAALAVRSVRPITVLDADVLRRTRWPELGFSREDRDLNIRRMGGLAAELTAAGGIAICAAIAPYARGRDEVRALIAPVGGFVLVHVATPVEVCERRDPKGLYARARRGALDRFTGVNDTYEPPRAADVVVDTTTSSPAAIARQIVDYLAGQSYLDPA